MFEISNKRQRTKIDRREPNGKRDTEQASLINTITAPKKQRTKLGTHNSWSSDPRTIEAVQEWFNDGPILDPARQKMSMASFAQMKGLSATTFKYYVHKDPNKRRKLGVPCGRKPLISNKTSDILCEVAIRHDRANMGLTPAQLEDKIQLVAPHLSLKQIQNHRSRTFCNKHKPRMKPKSVMPQRHPVSVVSALLLNNGDGFRPLTVVLVSCAKRIRAVQEVWTVVWGSHGTFSNRS